MVLKSSGCGSGAHKCDVNYRVEVPVPTATRLTLEGGDIQVRGLSGTTYAKSQGGSVEVADSSAKAVTAATEGGNVRVSFKGVPDKVDAGTEAGNTTVRLPDGVYDVDARTEAGRRSVGVKTDPASSHKVQAHTEAGNVSVETAG